MIQKQEESDQVHNLSRGLVLAIERRRSTIRPHVKKIKFNFGEFDPSRISPPRDLECSVNESCNRIQRNRVEEACILEQTILAMTGRELVSRERGRRCRGWESGGGV